MYTSTMAGLVHATYIVLVCINVLVIGVKCFFPTCERGPMSLKPINKRLKVPPLSCGTATNLRQCAEDCVRTTTCLSVVFNHQTKSCIQFTENRSAIHDNDFLPEQHSVFIDIDEYKPACHADPCRNKPCGTKQLCGRNGQDFICYDKAEVKCVDRLITGPNGVDNSRLGVSGNLPNSRTHYLRLNTVWNAWQPYYVGRYQWAQVQFYEEKTIRGVITAGRPSHSFWVTEFKVMYSTDACMTFATVKDNYGNDKKFPGNWDVYSHLETYFDAPFRALCVRINPWNYHGRVGLRLDIIGCCNKIEDDAPN